MIKCAKCNRFIMDFYEQVYLVVNEGDTPDKAVPWCAECYEIEL